MSLLVSSYRPGYWASESFGLLYKLMLTGCVHLLPGPRLQIWLGVLGNVALWSTLIVHQPFRSRLCNVVASLASLQLLLSYVSAFLFLENNGFSRLSDLDGWIGTLLIILPRELPAFAIALPAEVAKLPKPLAMALRK